MFRLEIGPIHFTYIGEAEDKIFLLVFDMPIAIKYEVGLKYSGFLSVCNLVN